MSHGEFLVKRVLVRGNSKSKGPEAVVRLAYFRKNKGTISLRQGRLEKKQFHGEENQKFNFGYNKLVILMGY